METTNDSQLWICYSIEKIWSEFWSGQSSTRSENDVNDDNSMDNIDLVGKNFTIEIYG